MENILISIVAIIVLFLSYKFVILQRILILLKEALPLLQKLAKSTTNTVDDKAAAALTKILEKISPTPEVTPDVPKAPKKPRGRPKKTA